MKILHIINDLSDGGAQKLITGFLPLMKDKGHEVEVLTIVCDDNVYEEDLEKHNITINCLSDKTLYSIQHILRVQKFIKNGAFDIVHVHLFPSLYFVGFASFWGFGKSKLVYTEHSTYNRRRNNKFFTIFDRYIYKQYHRIIAITEEVKITLENHLNCNKDFISIINNGTDISKFRNSPAIDFSKLLSSYNKNNKIICMIGRFSEAKDQPTLIKAISLLSKNIKLLLIGEGSLKEQCISLSKELNVQDRVYFLGFRKDIPIILKACDLGVLSSNWEGMPIFALEVFASGIPFIGSEVLGIKDLFTKKDDSSILLFKNKDSVGLSKLIEVILKKEELRSKNIEICKNIVNNFSLERMTDSYLNLYKNLN